MSHHIYHTHGFILASGNVGEANRFITIFTRELGVVSAVAQGVRKGSSKLRYALQDYSYAHIDLVRGAHTWRVTSAVAQNDFDALRDDKDKFALAAKLFSMIRRLCPGEEQNERLFDEINADLLFLQSALNNASMLGGFELVVLLRILHELGHLASLAEREEYLSGAISTELCMSAEAHKGALIKAINTAIQSSQL